MANRLIPCLVVVLLIAGCGGRPNDTPNQPAPVLPGETAAVDGLANADASVRGEKPSTPSPTAKEPKEEPADDSNSPLRSWRDPAGKVLAKGQFVALLDGKVCLQTEDGLGTFVALDQLSDADRKYAHTQSGGELAEIPVEAEVAEALAGPSEDHPSGPVGGQMASASGSPPESYGGANRRKVVIPFDFESKFDDGRYGSMLGDMFWKKLDREGGFLVPETMLDVRDVCKANHIKLGPATPLSTVKNAVTNDFDADIGIWGSVERVEGQEWDVYDLVIKCADFTSGPEPKMVYEVSARTKVVSEIPHLYGKQLLDKLYDRRPGGAAPVDLLAEENWKNNPSLVIGDFQKGSGGVPEGWASVGGQHREPLGGLVRWVQEAGNPGNKVIRLAFDEEIGNSYGVMYYSDWFPVDEGAKYRFECRYRTNGPAVKVFIKCYAEMASKYKDSPAAGTSSSRSGPDDYVPETAQRRECYRSQQNLKGPKNVWNTQTEDFTPKHTKYVPKWGRVMLYGYLGAGVVEFDDVVLKQIVPASPSETRKDPRHSMQSTVTLKDMRENEQRGREAAEKLKQPRK